MYPAMMDRYIIKKKKNIHKLTIFWMSRCSDLLIKKIDSLRFLMQSKRKGGCLKLLVEKRAVGRGDHISTSPAVFERCPNCLLSLGLPMILFTKKKKEI